MLFQEFTVNFCKNFSPSFLSNLWFNSDRRIFALPFCHHLYHLIYCGCVIANSVPPFFVFAKQRLDNNLNFSFDLDLHNNIGIKLKNFNL